MMDIIQEINQNVVIGNSSRDSKYPPDSEGKDGVEELVNRALKEGIPVSEILKKGLIDAMEIVGAKFSAGDYFVPEMLFSAKAMKAGMALIEPLLKAEGKEKYGVVVLGTVLGDMHDIGKNLAALFLEGSGFEVIDLGINTPVEKFVDACKLHPSAVVGMSALLTTTMENMRVTINGLRAANLDNKVIIGGAAVSQKFADEIGADGYAHDAAQSAPLVKDLLQLT